MKTHPNFKSAIDNFKEAEAIYKYMTSAIDNQEEFDKRTLPPEKTVGEIEKFQN